MSDLNAIETRAREYADARAKMAECVAALQLAIKTLHRKNLPRIKRAMTRAFELESQLRQAVEESPGLFTKPKTMLFHGIRVGFEKGKGAIEFADADQVVKLIEKRLPDLAEQLVKTTKKPLKGGLKQLTVAQLKSIGCTVEETGDQVVVRAVDGEVDKLVRALLKGLEDSTDEDDAED